jgi:16S rRNA (guanine527-N7)-methyltransferase
MSLSDAADPLDRFGFVTPTIRADLGRFVRLLQKWQATHNLVSPASLPDIWERHIADSLQLMEHAPRFGRWVDLGSGAGFPGLVIALACKAELQKSFTLIESNQKKAAFLRAAIAETGAKARVVAERIEAYAASHSETAEVVSARALARLDELCGLAAPLLSPDGVMLLLKGQDFARELAAASQSWDFDMLESPSVTDPGGRVVVIRNLSRKVEPHE